MTKIMAPPSMLTCTHVPRPHGPTAPWPHAPPPSPPGACTAGMYGKPRALTARTTCTWRGTQVTPTVVAVDFIAYGKVEHPHPNPYTSQPLTLTTTTTSLLLLLLL